MGVKSFVPIDSFIGMLISMLTTQEKSHYISFLRRRITKAELRSFYNIVKHNGVIEKVSVTLYIDYLPVLSAKVNLIKISLIPAALAHFQFMCFDRLSNPHAS